MVNLQRTYRCPTPAVDDNSLILANTAFIQGQKGTTNPLPDGTATPGTSAKWTPIDHIHPAIIAGGDASTLSMSTDTGTPWHDDTTVDWTTRYATVTGTAIAHAAPGYNLVANTDSTYRFRSYKWAAVAGNIVKVTLPASCNAGDYVYVKFAAQDGALSDGYGVGVIRQATDVWNVCTVEGTTVTDTTVAVTNLNDGDIAFIKWDKTAAGFTHYVRENGEAYPAGTNVADTTYTWGYLGFVAHSASGSKTFVLNDVSMPDSGILGYYNDGTTPIPRGARIGKYWNGAAWVNCTGVIIDPNWDQSAEITCNDANAVVWDTTNGQIIMADDAGAEHKSSWVSKKKMGYGIYVFDMKSVAASANALGIAFGKSTSSTENSIGKFTDDSYLIRYYKDGAATLRIAKVVSGTAITLAAVTGTDISTRKYLIIEWNPTGVINVYVTSDINSLGTVIITATDTSYSSGYFGMTHEEWLTAAWIYGVYINALSPDSTNGILASVSGVNGGARYDAQEEVYLTLTNPAKYATAKMLVTAKTTDAAADDVQMYYYNTTDSSYIDSGDSKNTTDLTVTTSFTDFIEDILLRHRDRTDTLKLSVRRKDFSGPTYDNQSAVFVETLALAPTTEV